MNNKKAELTISSLQGVIVALIVIGIVLGLGFLLLQQFEETMGDTVTTISNESINVTDEGIYVAFNSTTAGTECYHSFTPVIFINESGDTVLIGSGNYSFEAATGRIWNLTSDASLGALNAWNITYSYSHSDTEACESVGDTIDAMQEIPGWLIIVVILLIAGILLAIVFKVMGGQGRTSAEI